MNSIIEKMVAHRGESFDYPENTLAAVNAAWELGVKAVEIDVHLSADNEVMVIHDEHTGRVGNKKLVVKKSKLADLKNVDVGAKKSSKFKGEQIPALRAVLKTIPEDAKLVVEIKCGVELIEPLVQLLENTTLASKQIEIISFNLEVVSAVKKRMPQYKALWLLDLDYYWPHWLLRIKPNKIIKTVKANNLDGVDVWAGKTINKSFVQAFKNEGLLFYVWTVNDFSEAQRVLLYGVDAVTSDRAKWMCQQLLKIE